MAKPKEKTKRHRKRAYTAKHSKEMVDIAVEALKKKTMSSYEAERAFGIPRRTLLDRLHNKHPKTPGCPTWLTEEEEANVCKVLIAAANYGSPLSLLDLRIVVHRYLEANGKLAIFNNKLPGKKWVYAFLKRNKSKLTKREVQNIKRSRAEKTVDEIEEYFNNLKMSLEGVPKENILNYDETNLQDNPGTQKCIFRRGVKYPERVLNFTKGAISIMFAITAGGECLPPYVVYKAEHLYTQWTINGPAGCRYNRSKSGWFDSILFEDWFKNIILPWAKTKTGPKLLIGDNLSSHINYQIVKMCEEHDIRFVFLPPNSSHITQPLDVGYFGPLKKLWREILLNYKAKNPRDATVHKGHFPDLLKKLVDKLNESTHTIISAFKATGISPLNPVNVTKRLPDYVSSTENITIDNVLLNWLKETRRPDPNKKIRNKKLNVPPGQSVSSNDFKLMTSLTKKETNLKRKKKQSKDNSTAQQPNSHSLSQSSLPLNTPKSLIQLSVAVVNLHLIQHPEIPDELSVRSFTKTLKTDEENTAFYGHLPESLTTKKAKITITSDITIPAKSSQSKRKIIKFKKDETKITRSALHMKLAPIKSEMSTEEKKMLTDRKQEPKNKQEKTKHGDKSKQRKIKREKKWQSQKATKRCKVLKQRNKRSYSTDSSSTHSGIGKITVDTDESDYETMDDYISACLEDQENVEPLIEPLIPFGISDVEYFTEDHKKFNTDSWVLAKFATKKSVKHFVGKVITIKDNIPEVKFARRVKESKFNKGLVFTYPRVDDICTINHLDDILLTLPEPNISRRGQIVFKDINLSKYNLQ